MDINKLIAKLPTGFVDDASGMDANKLRAEIIKAETSLRELDTAMKADEKLAGAKEIVKDIVGGYNDVKRAQRAKIAYVLHVLEERGELGTGAYAIDEELATVREPSQIKTARSKDAPARKRAA